MEWSPCSAQTAVTTAREPGDAGPERGAEEEGAKKNSSSRKRSESESSGLNFFGSLGIGDQLRPSTCGVTFGYVV